MHTKRILALALPLALTGAEALAQAADAAPSAVKTLRFVQDDAQDYMVSKIYHLKYAQSNDLMPFLMGIVMRYNLNSTVNCIEYGDNNAQMLTVTCPVELMPYVDDFVAKADRPIKIDGKVPDEIIRGTGITRAVYRPKYRSGQNLLDVLVNSVIGAGPYSSVYAWDANSNQIYWKDNSSNTEYVYEFLGYLDRPAPQITLTFTLYEVRESTLRDLGIEYLAWKNGPGLDLARVGWDVFSVTSAGTAAIQAASGPVGGFMFAPQFDASFIRALQQSGNAKIQNSASITVSNSDTSSYSIAFNPEFQNILKSSNDRTSVGSTTLSLPNDFNQLALQIDQPIVNVRYGSPQSGFPDNEIFSVTDYSPGDYAKMDGTLFFGCTMQTASVIERNNLGAEAIETHTFSTNMLIPLNAEAIVGRWDEVQEVEQTIGIPWLVRVPILKYLFGTTTTSTEKVSLYLTAHARLMNTSALAGFRAGDLVDVGEAVKAAQRAARRANALPPNDHPKAAPETENL